MVTSTLFHNQFIRQDSETITEYFPSVIFPTHLNVLTFRTSTADIIPHYSRGKNLQAHRYMAQKEVRNRPPRPTLVEFDQPTLQMQEVP